MKLLPGTLVLNDSNQFICDRVECNISYKNINYDTTLCIANSYGKYIKDEKYYNPQFHPF